MTVLRPASLSNSVESSPIRNMAENETRCPICETRGERSKLQFFNINLEEAVSLCENKFCVYPFGYRPLTYSRNPEISSPGSADVKAEIGEIADERSVPDRENVKSEIVSARLSNEGDNENASEPIVDRIESVPSIGSPKETLKDDKENASSEKTIEFYRRKFETWKMNKVKSRYEELHGASDALDNNKKSILLQSKRKNHLCHLFHNYRAARRKIDPSIVDSTDVENSADDRKTFNSTVSHFPKFSFEDENDGFKTGENANGGILSNGERTNDTFEDDLNHFLENICSLPLDENEAIDDDFLENLFGK